MTTYQPSQRGHRSFNLPLKLQGSVAEQLYATLPKSYYYLCFCHRNRLLVNHRGTCRKGLDRIKQKRKRKIRNMNFSHCTQTIALEQSEKTLTGRGLAEQVVLQAACPCPEEHLEHIHPV